MSKNVLCRKILFMFASVLSAAAIAGCSNKAQTSNQTNDASDFNGNGKPYENRVCRETAEPSEEVPDVENMYDFIKVMNSVDGHPFSKSLFPDVML